MSHEIVLYGKGKGKAIDDPTQRKFVRRTVDYGSNVVRWLEDCLGRRLPPQRLQSHYSYTKELMPPFATPQSPYDAICCRFVNSSTNKNRAPVNVVHWFPNGRRLISGTQTGEITIWNGFQFHFENILQAHNAAVRAMQWTPEETVLVSGDQLGIIKFWDQYLYNFQTFQAHKESICDITIAPTGLKFCSCADDSHAKVWDLRLGEEERAFTGHGWDVKCCNWHPTKGLVATGSKDSQIKLWDPRASEAITTIFCHKNTVTRVVWSPNGQWLASGSRDQLVMLMDIRTMRVRKVFKAHQKEVTALCWHPESDALLASGGYDAALHFWDAHGAAQPMESVPGAHEGPVWSLSWHPLGHLLVSGSHDYSTRFWSRARPGDTSWTELLPKKIGLGANEPPLPPPPSKDYLTSTFESGIFAKPSPPAPPPGSTPEGANGEATAAVAEAKGQVGAKPPERLTSGLSLSEGGSRKDVLDTSDFDAEDAEVAMKPRASQSAAAPTPAPAVKAPAAPQGQAPAAAADAAAAEPEKRVEAPPPAATSPAPEAAAPSPAPAPSAPAQAAPAAGPETPSEPQPPGPTPEPGPAPEAATPEPTTAPVVASPAPESTGAAPAVAADAGVASPEVPQPQERSAQRGGGEAEEESGRSGEDGVGHKMAESGAPEGGEAAASRSREGKAPTRGPPPGMPAGFLPKVSSCTPAPLATTPQTAVPHVPAPKVAMLRVAAPKRAVSPAVAAPQCASSTPPRAPNMPPKVITPPYSPGVKIVVGTPAPKKAVLPPPAAPTVAAEEGEGNQEELPVASSEAAPPGPDQVPQPAVLEGIADEPAESPGQLPLQQKRPAEEEEEGAEAPAKRQRVEGEGTGAAVPAPQSEAFQ